MKTINDLLQVSHPLARNILRGLPGALSNYYDIEKALIKIEKTTTKHNTKQALTILRTSPIYNNNSLTRHFNSQVPKKLIDICEYNQNEIIQIINHSSENLKKCLIIVKEIYSNINNKNFKEAINNCIKLIDNKGVSLVLYRLLIFLKNRLEYIHEHSHYATLIDEILNKIQISNLTNINDGVKQIISDRADYFTICSKISNANIQDYSKRILLSFISHSPSNEEDFIKNLNAHLSYSLLDSLLYLSLTKRMKFHTEEYSFPIEIQAILNEIALIKINLSYYQNSPDSDFDISFYREAYLLIEQDDCLKYKTVHAPYFNLPDTTLRIKTAYESEVIKEYFGSLNCISDLRYEDTKSHSINLNKFDKKSCSIFENSSAFDYLINKVDGCLINNKDDEIIFIKLMSRTRDIASLCLPEYIETIKNRTENLEVKLIALCLLTASSLGGDDDADFELRKVFQNLCASKFDGDILETLKSFYEISPSITDYFLMSFDEIFISRLFNIDVRPNQALYIRADLFDWYGDITGEKKYHDRAKNTRIDIQINKHRQHIDDSRIYAEPARVIQWITDNINNQLALQFDNLDILDNRKINLEWSNLTSNLNPENSIGIAISDSYNEFVNNKIYGINSYLGRRIRHGTAKGTGVEEVKALALEQEFKPLFSDQYFVEEWEKWLDIYIASFDELIGEFFHIKSDKKKKGLLSPLIDNEEKFIIANSLVNALYKSYMKIDNVALAPALITDYCWRLIDGDLAKARQHILKVKSSVSVFNIKDQNRLINRRLSQKFSNEINALTEEKFSMVCSWFNKPSYATQSADISLLLKVVVNEIKSQKPKFSPTIQDENTTQMLTGGHYFVIYDSLTVIINNIAEHGNCNGLIVLNYEVIQPKSKDEIKSLAIKITSESVSNEAHCIAKKRIKDKLTSNNISDANIIEGNSGIIKLKSMEFEKLIHNLDYSFDDNSCPPKITAMFSIELDY